MNVTSTEQVTGGLQFVQPILRTNTQFRADNLAGNVVQAAQPSPRHVGYGLPCAKCGTYYMANQSICPVCKCGERISPTALPARAGLQNAPPDIGELEIKRDPFPKEFKSQPFSAHPAAGFRCSLEANHQGAHEPAAVCRPCYDHLQERVDLMEAALHIDLREAAQIVYEAVWSDPSDSSKTYQNAAEALLAELHKRARLMRFTRVRVV
jgi:hypothetical protein